MVTIKKTTGTDSRYLRVRNTTREDLISLNEKLSNGWIYCPKGEWKKDLWDRRVK